MKSFKCLCLKCTWLILLVLRSPHVSSVCMGVAVTSSLQHRDRKKPFFPLIALADCLLLLSLVQLKKSLFSQCIPTGTLQKCFFYWSCRPDVRDCACLSVSVWKNKMSSLVRAGAFFYCMLFGVSDWLPRAASLPDKTTSRCVLVLSTLLRRR